MTNVGKVPEARTRSTILNLLKRQGAQDAGRLSQRLGISAMAVRQHLYAMQAEGLIGYEEEPRPVGRPAKLWRLTPSADRFFPDGYADLTLGLVEDMKAAFGEAGFDKILEQRSRSQTAAYRGRVGKAVSLPKRLAALAAIRSEEGYMAEVEKIGPGSYLLIENHCPICRVAAVCTGLCAAEMAVFRAVLGPDVSVERTDHILAGARRCAYRVTKTG